jgi:rubrerythrin
MKFDEIIRKGIELEDNAYYFYIDQSKSFPSVAKFFTMLAIEEMRHKRLLEIFLETKDFLISERMANEENVLASIESGDHKQYHFENIGAAVDQAIKLEIEAFELYAILFKEERDPEVNKLLRSLMEMEYKHADLLKQRFGR